MLDPTKNISQNTKAKYGSIQDGRTKTLKYKEAFQTTLNDILICSLIKKISGYIYIYEQGILEIIIKQKLHIFFLLMSPNYTIK